MLGTSNTLINDSFVITFTLLLLSVVTDTYRGNELSTAHYVYSSMLFVALGVSVFGARKSFFRAITKIICEGFIHGAIAAMLVASVATAGFLYNAVFTGARLHHEILLSLFFILLGAGMLKIVVLARRRVQD